MLKTKPSVALICGLAVLTACACNPDTPQTTTYGAQSMRPIGPILALRMTPYRDEKLNFGEKVVRPVPESHVKWRVESVLVEVLGASWTRTSVDVTRHSAEITGVVPTGWQAQDIAERLERVDVLRSVTLKWRVLDPRAERPVPPPDDSQLEADAGATPPSP